MLAVVELAVEHRGNMLEHRCSTSSIDEHFYVGAGTANKQYQEQVCNLCTDQFNSTGFLACEHRK